MSLITLPLAPTIADIDQAYLLAVNWVPPEVGGGYSAYEGWNVSVATPPTNAPTTTFTNGLDFGGTVSSPSWEDTLHVGDYSIDMAALPVASPPLYIGNIWDSAHTFPPDLNGNVSYDNPTLFLGQTLTITLASAYPTTNVSGNPISGWQVLYQDGTSSGWLPITNRVVAKIFNTPGQQNIVVQTQCDYSAASPPVKLTRSFAFSVFVVNQQWSASASTAITGTLGVGGEQGFEITGTGAVAVPAPYEVIVRSLVRDTITNELKLLVATSRFSNASSLLGTMALDVFPLSGRPQATELVEPLAEVTAAASSSSPVKIQTTALPGNSYIGKPMLDFKMAASGGIAPYSWFSNGLPPGLQMSIDGTISGTPTRLGNFTVDFSVMDGSVPAFIAETTLVFAIPTDLAIVTASLPGAVVLAPYSVQMTNTGGLFPFTWSVQGGKFPVGITLNQSTGLISGVPCTYSLQDFGGPFSVTLQVQDAVGALASKTYSIVLSPAALQVGLPDQPLIYAGQSFRMEIPIFGGKSPYTVTGFSDDGMFSLSPPYPPANAEALEGGQFEVEINVPNTKAGTHYFVVTIQDSASATASKTVYYTVGREVSNIVVSQPAFDHDWGTGDTESLGYPIEGQLGGFQLNFGRSLVIPSASFSRPSGLTATVYPSSPPSTSPPVSPPLAAPAVEVIGPPSAFCNSEVRFPFPLTNGAAIVTTISQEFTLLTQSALVSTYTRPYIVGDFVALNPRRPYFNSPEISITPGIVVRVQSGSALPPGISLDQDTGLVYGTLVGTYGSLLGGGNASILEYVDSNGVVQGTVTVYWDTLASAFTLSSGLPSGSIQKVYTGTITTTSSSNLASASVYRGVLPAGLSLSVTGTSVVLSGTPAEAGYFDLWIKAANVDGHSAYVYQRLAVTYATPLVILTSTLPAIVINQAYSQALQGYGGVPAYTWSSDMASSAAALVPYITLDASTGVLSGTVTDATLNGHNYNVTFTLTDSNGTVVTRVVTLSVNNALVITTTAVAPITLASPYSFTMQAAGGIPPYHWSVTVGSLPTSITMNDSGVISGTTADSGYGTEYVTFQVTDSTYVPTPTTSLPVTVGAVAGMTIDPSGVGTINRGSFYLGTPAVDGTFTTPVSWTVTADSPNPLPSGLTLTPSSSDSGATARIVGLYTGAAFAGYLVKVQAVDIAGHMATATLSLIASSNLAITTLSPLPTAVVGTAYQPGGSPFQFAASGGGSPSGGTPSYTWAITASPGGFPFSLSSGGVLTGTPGVNNTWTFTVQVSDAMSPADTASDDFTITASSSTLAISTASPLPSATAGVAYSTILAATGGTPPYAWALVGGSLPTGLSLSSGGTISGTTNVAGNVNITVQVTDGASTVVQKAFVLPVNVGLTLHAGVDYVDSLSLGILGYVATGNADTISPRTNRSFYIVATGVIATSPSQLLVTVPSGYTSVVESVSGGTAYIRLSGPFASGFIGSNTLNVGVTDVGGINASGSFTWIVYANGALRPAPGNGSIPAYGVPLLEGTSASLPVYNDPNNPTFTFQQYNGQNVDKPSAATADFSLTGDNSSYQGKVGFGFDGTNFSLSYGGAGFDSHVALTNLALSDEDIAWFNSANKSFDTFAVTSGGGGKSQALPVLYMVKPTVASVTPNPLTIPTSNISTVTAGPNFPRSGTGWTNASAIEANTDAYASVQLNNQGAPELVAQDFGFNIPLNATITGLSITIKRQLIGGISPTLSTVVVFVGNQVQTVGNLSWPSSAGTITFGSPTETFGFTNLTPTNLNASIFGLWITVVSLGSTSLGVYYVTMSVTYKVPNYSNIVVALSKPFSPQQQGTASGTGNSISASATMSNGVTVVGVTPNYDGGGWLTGWTIEAQFPSGTGTVVSVLSMTVGGVVTYMGGTSMLFAQAISYISGAVATITANRG
jgi:hypothetical protein